MIGDISPQDLYGSLLTDDCGAKSRGLLGDIKYSPGVFSNPFTTRRCHSDLPAMIVILPGDLEKFCSQIYDEEVMPDELLRGGHPERVFDGHLVQESLGARGTLPSRA